MNGSFGVVRKIVYKDHSGPNSGDQILPSHVIAEFKDIKIPKNEKAFDHLPSTYVPIPVTIEFFQKRCCTMSTVPLRVCIALIIHKSQGITIGNGEIFEKAIVNLPDLVSGQKSTSGLELVGMSRVKDPNSLAIGNLSTSLSVAQIQKIGTSNANKKPKISD